jgi:hypothetical protein
MADASMMPLNYKLVIGDW